MNKMSLLLVALSCIVANPGYGGHGLVIEEWYGNRGLFNHFFKVGETYKISLDEQGEHPGDRWQTEISPKGQDSVTMEQTVKAGTMPYATHPGVPSKRIWTIKAIKRGGAEVELRKISADKTLETRIYRFFVS